MEAKRWYASKTFWFGALWVLINVAGLFGFETYQPDPTIVSVVNAAAGLLVVILRLVTKQPIK